MPMKILVCVKRVPDPSETEFEITPGHSDIQRDELVYSINESDNYAVEEAIQISAKIGGDVTVVTVGDEEDEEVLRREMAMGAKNGVLISDPGFAGSDGRGIATILKAYVAKHNYDLILTGVQADAGGAQVGGMLAALLDYPFASLVNGIEIVGARKLKISREVEGGAHEISEIDLPCVLSIQTGINEPRYVGMRGIRQVASIPIASFDGEALGLSAEKTGAAVAKVKRVDYFVPVAAGGARMLSGNTEQMAEELVDILIAKGGLK